MPAGWGGVGRRHNEAELRGQRKQAQMPHSPMSNRVKSSSAPSGPRGSSGRCSRRAIPTWASLYVGTQKKRTRPSARRGVPRGGMARAGHTRTAAISMTMIATAIGRCHHTPGAAPWSSKQIKVFTHSPGTRARTSCLARSSQLDVGVDVGRGTAAAVSAAVLPLPPPPPPPPVLRPPSRAAPSLGCPQARAGLRLSHPAASDERIVCFSSRRGQNLPTKPVYLAIGAQRTTYSKRARCASPPPPQPPLLRHAQRV